MILRIPIEINAQIALSGRSTPPQIDYSVRNRSQGVASTFDLDIGPVVSHLFQVLFYYLNIGKIIINKLNVKKILKFCLRKFKN